MKQKGFTLIELLIVVAIIAILAAIAIPNFLQAQIRAKISRVKADMRSEATALESYYVDNNQYPEERAGTSSLIGPAGVYGAFRLTTPIAYISDLPESPFDEKFGRASGSPAPMVANHKYYLYVSEKKYDGSDNTALLYTDVAAYMPGNTNYRNVKWELKSVGPDQDDDMYMYYNGGTPAAPYDPTNGTTSSGDIVWFGPGYPPSF